MTTAEPTAPYRPWFLRRPRLALAGVALLFVLITALRVTLGSDATPGVTLLYVLPISLTALAWGRWPGLGASLVAIVMLVLWVLVADVELSALGWAARVVPLLMAGFLLGDASDRLHRAEAERLRYAGNELLHRQAVEVNDSLIQGMAATKWALEMGRHEVAIQTLDETIRSGQQMVSELIRQSGLGPTDD